MRRNARIDPGKTPRPNENLVQALTGQPGSEIERVLAALTQEELRAVHPVPAVARVLEYASKLSDATHDALDEASRAPEEWNPGAPGALMELTMKLVADMLRHQQRHIERESLATEPAEFCGEIDQLLNRIIQTAQQAQANLHRARARRSWKRK